MASRPAAISCEDTQQLISPQGARESPPSVFALPRAAFTVKLQLPAAIVLAFVTYALALGASLVLKINAEILDTAPVWAGSTAILWVCCRRRMCSSRVTLAVEATALIAVLGLSLACLSYLAMIPDLPLRDAEMVWLDRRLGFDWLRVMKQLDSLPWLVSLLNFAYATFTPQLIGTVVFFAATNRAADLDRFFVTFVCASMFAEGASLATPTLGPIPMLADHTSFVNLPTLGRRTSEIVLTLRLGVLKSIDFKAIDGIISFPSLHAAVAIIVPFTWRRFAVVFRWLVVLDGLMLASAVPSGNHYLADVLGGVGVAVLAIVSTPYVQRGVELLTDVKWSPLRNIRNEDLDSTLPLGIKTSLPATGIAAVDGPSSLQARRPLAVQGDGR